ncbi:MAG: hypothetical protein HQL46_04705 [Gammaproteobacteria bacterium]|nr:hypothetical protein [Gammaproteobacteria bacterium]
MSDIVKLVLNNDPILQFDRNIPIPKEQKAFLMQMEIKMSGGFELSGKFIQKPDLMQKSQFVALNMLEYIVQENFSKATGLFTYIVDSLTDLQQVNAQGTHQNFKVEFVFDEDYHQWQEVKFS